MTILDSVSETFPAETGLKMGVVLTIGGSRPEAYANITTTLKKYYGFGKFFTWPDGIESCAEWDVPDLQLLNWDVNSLVDHIRNLNAYPDPDRSIYCKVTLQVTRPGSDTPYQEFRY